MTFAQFLSILRARKWAALLVFSLVVATTVVVSLMLPKQYLGTASVVIDIKPDPVSATLFPGMATPGFIATQADILMSERVTLRVIRDLKLMDNAPIREQWQTEAEGAGTFEQYLIELLQKYLEVKPSLQSNVISIEYKSPSPQFAAGLANAFAQAYIATTLELRGDPARQFNSFFQAQTKDARDSLERAQQRLSAFQQDKGIIVTNERLDIESARLAELSSQLTQSQSISAESSSRQAQARGDQSDRLQEVLNNPLISGLKADLTRYEAKLQELSQRLGDKHPQVLEARANIAELRSKIDVETRRVTSGVSVSNTINKSREGQLSAALNAQRTKMLEMKAVLDEGQVLQREVQNAQSVYDNLVARLNQSALEAQNTQSYASVLTVAQPPAEHSSPKTLLNTLLAIFLGAMLAVGVALLMEMTDRRVRNPEDAVAALGLPVLGSLPVPGAKRFNPARPVGLSLATRQRAMSLPAPGVQADI
ncbi:chain length determinant protein EpsF [Paucibacter sp. PLA-PC-4]|uniref:chain length determinant protein EpsF n=1 Tax=Paucibacter sp. PLA-PC-4 TaxID=2993655 RepID=UPI00224A9CD9|nr:chain length determinant protein EpsF [Paucibacter sp. PLA-PC-4]MCX2865277.1 chain length determinant protein EpsF [Paucibacter sp. PLA-PC-4]